MTKSLIAISTLLVCAGAAAQGATPQTDPASCASIADNSVRLACYDNWALRNAAGQPAAQSKASSTTPAHTVTTPSPVPSSAATLPSAPNPEAPAATQTAAQRAATQPSEITRFWDLEHASARDTLEIRGYRPMSLALSNGDSLNAAPSSPTRDAIAPVAYNHGELKINLSVRTKVASGLLRSGDDPLRDSLWFGYTQQSYWQVLNTAISRPFRATDHEPELVYVYPHALPLPAGWTYRLSGLGLVHQSNGQGLPLSRSWNRAYLVAAADKIAANGDRFTLQARLWQRIDKRSDDDNPDISNFVGRAELAGRWSFDTGTEKDKTAHTLGLVLRHSLQREARGSARLEYLRSIGNANSGLRFHTQLFTGYGDSLIDYNKKRTVLSVGVSLVDW
jgi:phospholipase A1/A2